MYMHASSAGVTGKPNPLYLVIKACVSPKFYLELKKEVGSIIIHIL